MEVTREAGMITPAKGIIGSKNNDTSLERRYIQHPIALKLKRINTMITRARRPPVVEQAWRSCRRPSRRCPRHYSQPTPN